MENKKIKILAIDDNNDNLISLKALIKESFPEALVYTALNGMHGIELATREDPDVILLDIIMPDMDGYEVCKVLKEDKKLFDIPVVFITALKGDSETRIKALDAGAEAFLAKPVEQSELTAQLRAMIKIKNANIDKRDEKEKLLDLVAEQTKELKATHIATLNLMEDLKKENEIRKENESFLKETQRIAKLGSYSLDIISGRWNSSEILNSIFGVEPDYEKTVENWVTIIHPDWQKKMNDYFINEVIGEKNTFNKIYKIINQKEQTEHWVHGIGNLKFDKDGNPITMIGTIRDISEQKQEELYRELSREVLQILNKSDDIKYSTMRILSTIKTFTGFDAIGLRLQDGEDYPYIAQKGFSKDFLLTENSLFEHSLEGGICRDKEGKPCLECTCGLVISGNTDPLNPIFTKGGSCFLNNSYPLLDLKLHEDPRHNPRNTCIHEGYASIALIPIRSKNNIVGLIHLNDKKKDRFTPVIIEILEGIASYIGESLMRKQAELEVLKSKEKAEENEQRLLTFINSIPDIVCYKDYFGRWLLANNADLELFGLTNVDYFGKTDIQLAPFTHNIYKEAFNTCMVSDEMTWDNKGMTKGIEVVTTPSGEKKHYDIVKIPIYKENGERKALAVIGRDITNLLNTQIELQKAKEKAEESDRLKSAFLANMSHEIRTPMNGILGFADLLKDPQLSGERQQYYISIIEKSGARMLNIINNIVSISKIESGTMEVSLSETNINDQIEYVYTFFKPEADNKGLQLMFKNTLHNNNATIRSDREKIYGILTNLVKNAIKFTDRGSIELGYYLKDNFLVFFVKDTGIGVPLERQHAIFERFIQADIEDKRAFQGAGLGLSISKAYVEMLGGKMWLESKVDRGSTFYFTIPYNNIENVKENKIEVVVEKNEKNLQLKKMKILIVEDDETSDFLITKILDPFSKEMLHARTGCEAVDICSRNTDIDMVLMDVNMPEMDGYEATRQIRQFNKDVVIIAQTAYALKGDKEKALNSGCTSYISKPIDKNVLIEIIKKYLKN